MYFSLAGSIIASAGSSSTPAPTWYYKEGSVYLDIQDRYWSDTTHWWSNADGTGTHPSVAPWTDATYLNYNLSDADSPGTPAIVDTVLSHAGTGIFTFATLSITSVGSDVASGTYIGTTIINGGTVSGGNFNGVTTFNNSGGTVSNTNSPIKGAATFVSGGYCAGGFGGFPFDGPGCADGNYCNFAPSATWSDGSCAGDRKCTNPSYCNYYAGTIIGDDCEDNSSCAGTPGCTNPSYCNYNPSAACDDGSCAGTPGCTNPAYCNYDPAADCDDGSCAGTPGCMDNSYCNYNPSATCDDGSCAGTPGCMNISYCNYNPSATCDNGGCVGIVGVDC